MDFHRGVHAVLLAAQAHVHQHQIGPMLLVKRNGLICGRGDAAYIQADCLQLHAQALRRSGTHLRQSGRTVSFRRHVALGCGMKIRVMCPALPFDDHATIPIGEAILE